MEVFGIFFALSIPLLFLGGIAYALFVLYQLIQRRKAGLPPQDEPLQYPHGFSAFIACVLVGFHAGLYWSGASSRVPVLGIAVFTSALAVGWACVYRKRTTPFLMSLIAILFLSNWGSVVRASGLVQGINGIIAVVSTLLLFIYFVRNFAYTSLLSLIETLLLLIPYGIKQFFVVLFHSFRSATGKSASHVAQWIKTLSLMLFVSLLFIAILSSADPVFAEIIRTFRDELLGRVFWSILILFAAAQALTSKLKEQKNEPWQLRFLSERDIATMLISVLVIGGIFLSVQYTYLFSGSRQLLVNLGLTFSEYVRKGFVEVLIATLAGGVLAYLAALKIRILERSSMKSMLQLGVGTLLVELALFLVSALKRDLLYVDIYGLTRTRIVGGLFLLWLAFFLVLLLFFMLRKQFSEAKVAVGLFVASCIVWAFINVLNVDALVANASPGHHEYTDYFYVALLSEDAGTAWVRNIPELEQTVMRLTALQELTPVQKSELAGAKLAIIALLEKKDKLQAAYGPETRPERDIPIQNKNDRRWQMWNYAQSKAYKLYASGTVSQEKLTTLKANIEKYQKQRGISLFEQEQRLLYELKYPFVSVELTYYPEDYGQYQVTPPQVK